MRIVFDRNGAMPIFEKYSCKGPFTLRVLLFFCLIKHFFGRFQTLYLFDHTLVFEFDLHKTVKQKNKKTVKHFSDILHMKQYSPDFV